MNTKELLDEYKFEPLYGADIKGKIKTWDLKVEKYEMYSEIVTIYGYNRLIETRRQINSGKNLGKKNQTTHYTQAILEAKSKWVKKRDIEKYVTDKENASKENASKENASKGNVSVNNVSKGDLRQNENPLPMLANDYNKMKLKVKKLLEESKIMVQPKLDGYRMIYNTTTLLITTRQGKEYSIIKESGKLYEELLKLPKGLILDGELYTSKVNFETLGILRKTKNLSKEDKINLSKIEYHIYDCINTTLCFYERNKIVKDLFSSNSFKKLIYVPTYNVSSEEEINNYHNKFLNNNYEGTMIRVRDSLYKTKQRTNDLLKYKNFEDGEFKIIDYSFEKDTSGKDENLIVWIIGICDNKIKCKVRPMGTKEERKELYKKCLVNFDQFKGRNLWVKYFEKTNDGNLRFPTTKCNTYTEYIRDTKN